MIKLAVVVPATDTPATLPRCLDAIRAAHDRPDEVIVVDGPSSLSAAGARNAGVARARADVVVFVDADVEVHPDAFTRLRASFAADPGLAAVYGSYDDTPAERATVSAFRNLLHHHVHQAGAGRVETFWTGLGAVRRSAFQAVGGFDEQRYPHPSIEDIDLGHRLAATGARIVLDPAVQGTHLKVWTLRSMLWTDFARRGIPWVALQARSRRVSRALNCGWRHRLSAAACVVGLVCAVAGLVAAAVGAAGLLVALNRSFYVLLARRLGPLRAAAGVALHGLHHLVSVAAVPAGLASVAVPRATRARRPSAAPSADRAPVEAAPVPEPSSQAAAPRPALAPIVAPTGPAPAHDPSLVR